MQQRTKGGIEPVAAVVRTKPLYVGRLLYHLSHRTPIRYKFLTESGSRFPSQLLTDCFSQDRFTNVQGLVHLTIQ